MKRFVFPILFLMIIPFLFACVDRGNVDMEYEIIGVITSIDEKIEIEVEENQNAYGTYLVVTGIQTKYYNKNEEAIKRSDLKIGDRILVTYNGQVARSLPPQIFALQIQKMN